MYKIKNEKIEGTINDSGWVVAYNGNCVTTWHRSLEIVHGSPDDIARKMVDNKDFPGWTGVSHCPGLEKNGVSVFSSTWDSSD